MSKDLLIFIAVVEAIIIIYILIRNSGRGVDLNIAEKTAKRYESENAELEMRIDRLEFELEYEKGKYERELERAKNEFEYEKQKYEHEFEQGKESLGWDLRRENAEREFDSEKLKIDCKRALANWTAEKEDLARAFERQKAEFEFAIQEQKREYNREKAERAYLEKQLYEARLEIDQLEADRVDMKHEIENLQKYSLICEDEETCERFEDDE